MSGITGTLFNCVMSIYDSLNEQQKKGVFTTEGPVLILAGAGSGKTRVITHRIAYLIDEKQVNPWNIMAITFTNKAAREMKERIDNLVGYGSESIWVSTFHSSCVRILRRFIDRIGYENNFTIYDADDQKTLMKEVCKKLNIDTKKIKEKAILSVISSAKNEMISPMQYRKQVEGNPGSVKLAEAYAEYQEQLKKNNALDFDDLLVLAVKLFTKHPDILEKYQERFKYIMVDEYQDTNTVQFKFVSMLAKKYRNLCVVGDDDQSIYKFRGANISNILDFEKVFEETTVIKLEQNYRSKANILNAANEVIKNNRTRKHKALWTEQDEGDLISFAQYENNYAEAEAIAADIQKNAQKGIFEYNQMACLYRTNAQSRAIEEKLIAKNIPYKIFGGVNFYQRKEIKDILAYLKTVDNGKDDVAVKRIINIPKRGIGLTTLEKVQSYADERQISFFEALMEADYIPGLGRATSKIKEFTNFIRVTRSKLGDFPLTDILNDIFEGTGYIEELKAENTEESKGRIENIDELVSKLTEYQNSAEEPTLSGFLEEVALVADIDNLENGNNYVALMTVHSAKGLEFPKVYLPGMEDGLFPSYMCIASDDPTDVEEERRLCYVAITRAMESLTISCSKARMLRGEMQYNKISRFVKEIPLKLIDNNSGVKVDTKPLPRQNTAYQTSRKIGSEKPYSSVNRPMSAAELLGMGMIKKGADIYNTTGKQTGTAKKDNLDYGVGDKVKHIKFGIGTVTAISDAGRDFEVTVNFEAAGIKKMFASFAKLKKLN